MKKTKRLVPKKRFKEFENHGEWEEQKLGNVVRFSKGKGYTKNDLQESGTPIILYGRLYTNFQTVINEVDTFVRDKKNSVYSTGTEVIVPSSGESAEDIARASLVEKKGIILGGDLNIMHLNEKKNPLFMALSISNGNRKKELIKRAQGSSVVHLYNTDLEEANVFFPTINEQEKISEFFKKLDNLISLQRYKLAKNKDLKSAYLSDLFPKEGEKHPKLRFQGFTEDWELIKFNNFSDVERGLTYSPNDIVDSDGVRVLRSSNIDDDVFVIDEDDVFVDKDAINIDYAENKNILITSANGSPRLVGKHAILEKIDPDTVHGGFMMLVRTNNPYFLNASMSSDWYKKFIKYHVSGGGGSIGNIKKSDLENQLIYVPSEKEQEKIGCFFKQLDDRIELEEEKLEKLEKIKEAYLNELFV